MKYIVILVLLISTTVNAQSSSSSYRLVIVGTTQNSSSISSQSSQPRSSFSSSAFSLSSSSSLSTSLSSSTSSSSRQPTGTMNIALAWVPPTKREDGSPLAKTIISNGVSMVVADISGYEVRWKVKGAANWDGIKIVPAGSRTTKIYNVPIEPHDVQIAVFDSNHFYSEFVNAIANPPATVTGLRTATQIIQPKAPN